MFLDTVQAPRGARSSGREARGAREAEHRAGEYPVEIQEGQVGCDGAVWRFD